jgi:hypothetical protein
MAWTQTSLTWIDPPQALFVYPVEHFSFPFIARPVGRKTN